MPALSAVVIRYRYLQKEVDLKAAQLTSAQVVIDAIKARARLEDSYFKEGFFSRLADMVGITTVLRTIFYPVCAYNDEERIAYLQEAAQNK